MSLNITSGSFGEIITAIQLVCRLTKALSASRGSARELQDLIVELRLYQNVLQQLIVFWESRRQCPKLNELANIARPAILDCRDSIEHFLEKAVRRYGRSLLRQTGSHKTFWDVVKMIQWNLCEKDDVEQLRDQLSWSKASIQMVQIQVNALASDQDHTVVSNRIASLVDAEREADAKIDARFAEMMENLEKGTKTMSRIEEVSNAVFLTVSSISNNVLAIRSAAQGIEQGMLKLHGMLSGLSLYNHNTVYLEDALGWTLPIVLDAHPSWETIHSILMDQFVRHQSPGLKLVKSKRYAIQDSKTGKDATLTVPFYQIARPGQKLNMSMVFNGDWSSGDEDSENRQESKCPSCEHVNVIHDPDVDITCQNSRCQLIYRIVIDVSDADEKRLNEWLKNNCKLNIHHHDEDDEDDNCDCKTNDVEIMAPGDMHLAEHTVDRPEIFKRVKFLSRWEDRRESRGNFWKAIGHMNLWDVSSHGVADMAGFQMLLSIKIQYLLYDDWITANFRPSNFNDYASWTWIGFAGHSRQKSWPVIIVTSDSNRVRRRLVQVVKRLDWIGTHSRFSVLTVPLSVFFPKKELEEFIDVVKTPGSTSYRLQEEARKRAELLKNRHSKAIKP